MTKRNKIIYWVATVWLALGMLSSGIFQLFRMEDAVNSMVHLGYPVYFLSILGTWKLLGVVAILIPGFVLLKEWAYAGFFFVLSGALTTHIIVGDGWGETFPSILSLVLVMVSWYFRPANRRIGATK